MLQDIPYSSSKSPYQSLDLWLPSSILGPEPVIFVVYIHGGAWSDPDQDKAEGHVLLNHLVSSHIKKDFKIACASLNYRLSLPGSRVQHPDHLNDVRQALQFLKGNYDLRKCLLIGHSAGATLAVQAFHEFRREILGLILFNGIYDLTELVDEYPSYNGFVSAAFGPLDQSDWTTPSPTHIIMSSNVKREHRHERIVLAHSPDDELLSMHQTNIFEEILEKRWAEPIERLTIGGKHDDSPTSTEMQEISRRVLLEIAQKLANA